MKNNALIGLGIVLLIIIGAYFAFSSIESSSVSDGSGLPINGETQRVVLSQDGLNYKDATAEAGKPIEISVDSSVQGCLRSLSFNLGGKRYVKYLKSNSDTLILPALEKGNYKYSCSMGMGLGTLEVK